MHTQWITVILIFCAGLAGACQLGKAPTALPVIRTELGLSLFAASWLISMITAIGACSGTILGALSDWLGNRRLTFYGLAGVALGSFLGALSSGASMLLFTRFLEGMGFFFIWTSGPALIARAAHPRDVRMALGVWSGCLPAGMAMIMLLSPACIAGVGWRGLWVMTGAFCVLLVGILFQATGRIKDPASGHARRPVTPWANIRTTVTKRGPVLLAGCFTLYSIQWMSVMGFLPTFFYEHMGTNSTTAAMLTALTVAVNFPGNVLGGWLLQRGVPRWRITAAAYSVMSLASLGVFWGTAPTGIRFLLCLFLSAGGGMIPAVLLAGTTTHAPRPDLVGTTSGVISQGANIGSTLGPPALALIVGAGGEWSKAPWLFILAGILGMVLSVMVRALESSPAEG